MKKWFALGLLTAAALTVVTAGAAPTNLAENVPPVVRTVIGG